MLLIASICHADMILHPIDRGRYANDGYHETLNAAYGVGYGGTFINNNFFVFNLGGLSEEVLSAELQLFNPWSISPDPFETYATYDVNTDLTSLMNGSGGTNAFNDLQSGNSYANVNISSADNGTTISMTLNAQAIQDINNSLGGLFAIGGTVTTLDIPRGLQEELFGFTSTDNPADGVDLRLTIIPEPSVLGLLLLGCGMLILQGIRNR
ncbi:MAG: PEP-CTERM sorting domain-containing protein [Verrucomicrobia bacterium]|nr:PEP-CTERM sorting domain-containing protein [Verrucomicrobiota bacterium]